VRILKHFGKTRKVPLEAVVNMATVSGDDPTFKIQVRHLDDDGILAFCFNTFNKYGWSVRDISFDSFAKRQACTTNIVFKGV